MGVNEHFESIFNAVMCQLKGFKTASKPFSAPHKNRIECKPQVVGIELENVL